MTEFRDRCIEAGRDAMGRNDGWRWWAPRHLAKLFDLWEPMIRADEVESRYGWVSREDARAWFLADLRAGVEGLHAVEAAKATTAARHYAAAYEVVLALMDGAVKP